MHTLCVYFNSKKLELRLGIAVGRANARRWKEGRDMAGRCWKKGVQKWLGGGGEREERGGGVGGEVAGLQRGKQRKTMAEEDKVEDRVAGSRVGKRRRRRKG